MQGLPHNIQVTSSRGGRAREWKGKRLGKQAWLKCEKGNRSSVPQSINKTENRIIYINKMKWDCCRDKHAGKQVDRWKLQAWTNKMGIYAMWWAKNLCIWTLRSNSIFKRKGENDNLPSFFCKLDPMTYIACNFQGVFMQCSHYFYKIKCKA